MGESYQLTQGNCTKETHRLSDNQHFAFDFKMPVGTPIVAMDSGRVAQVIEHYKDHIDTQQSQANLIVIEHSGGITNWYGHLMFESARVRQGDRVTQGQVIGYRGNTGASAYPHLHIHAKQFTEDCYNAKTRRAQIERCPQIPIVFKNVNSDTSILVEFNTYKALPY